jgi:DNA-binding transcriptional MerR regulator
VNKLITISQLSKILNLVNSIDKKPSNHVLRYWEKQFKQIKPKIINKRRYYSPEQVEIIKMIKFLLKNKGMTITGVKNVLNFKINKLDVYDSDSLKAEYYKKSFKEKSKTLLNKIKKLKNYGKKNSSKS